MIGTVEPEVGKVDARTLPRVFARPFELRRGQWLSAEQIVDRLNDLGYAERAKAEQPGEFSRIGDTLTLIARGGTLAGRAARITFSAKGRGMGAS